MHNFVHLHAFKTQHDVSACKCRINHAFYPLHIHTHTPTKTKLIQSDSKQIQLITIEKLPRLSQKAKLCQRMHNSNATPDFIIIDKRAQAFVTLFFHVDLCARPKSSFGSIIKTQFVLTDGGKRERVLFIDGGYRGNKIGRIGLVFLVNIATIIIN